MVKIPKSMQGNGYKTPYKHLSSRNPQTHITYYSTAFTQNTSRNGLIARLSVTKEYAQTIMIKY